MCNALSFVHIRMRFTRTAYSKGKSKSGTLSFIVIVLDKTDPR